MAAEGLVVFVVAAVATTHFGIVRDEFDALEPLHVPGAMPQLVAQPQRSTVAVAQWFVFML
ncbi:hypothetical protein A4G27_23430 [Mycobacterium kansasii]|nr:hypothetical protein A4G27_23430 [Mycobacterium kansasii]